MKRVLGIDALVVFVLTIARVRIDTLGDAVVAKPAALIAKTPLFGWLMTDDRVVRMEFWITDPVTLLGIAVALASLVAYLLVDYFGGMIGRHEARRVFALKLVLVLLIVASTTGLGSVLNASLRSVTEPAQYAHDGGVVQTEEAIKFLLKGSNPYSVSYADTPMGRVFPAGNTALEHYPYLPLTFLLPAPLFAAARDLALPYDQRFIYLAALFLLVGLAPFVTANRVHALTLVAILGLNPILGIDVVYGMNDIFVLLWIGLGVVLLRWGRPNAAMLMIGLACASKPTAWFFVPFALLLMTRGAASFVDAARRLLRPTVVLALTLGALVIPFILWDWRAFWEDVWGWSSGAAAVSYPITGWGFALFVLVFGWVRSSLDYYPFIIWQAVTAGPLLFVLLWTQWRDNSLARATIGYALFLFVFFYFSRFINENYLGFLAGVAALGCFADTAKPAPCLQGGSDSVESVA